MTQTHKNLLMKSSLLSLLLAAMPLCASAEEVLQDSTLHSLVVTGTRTEAPERGITSTVSTLSRQDLVASERVSLLPTLSERVPGLFVTQRGVMGYGVSGGAAGGITVRGLSSAGGQVMVLVDGHPQYQGIFGHAIADAYQTMVAERVEVVRGPASLLYGSNALGGVVNIITRQDATPTSSAAKNSHATDLVLGAGSYGSFQAEASHRQRAGKFSANVALNYQRSDNHRPSMGFYQYGGVARIGYDVSANWRAWAALNLTHFAASNPGSLQAPLLDARQWVNRGVVEAAVENHYARTSGAVSVYHNFGRHKINDGHAASAAPRDFLFRSRDALTDVSAHQGIRLCKGNWTTLGFDYQNIHGEAWNADILTDERLNRTMEKNMHYPLDKNLTEVGAYVDVRQDVAAWWTVEAGVRIDHHTEAGTEWVPRAGFVFRPLATAELKLTAAKGFRVPTLREMFLYGVANPDLRPERLWNYELAWKQRLAGGRFTYGVNVFYLKATNLIGTTMVAEVGRAMNYNTGATEHYGAELEAALRLGDHWQLSTNHSYLHTQHPVLAAPEYKGNLGARYTLGALEVGADITAATGICTNVATEHHEHAVLLNASAAYRLLPQLRLWVRGENLLAQRYELCEGYPMPRATVMAGVRLSF